MTLIDIKKIKAAKQVTRLILKKFGGRGKEERLLPEWIYKKGLVSGMPRDNEFTKQLDSQWIQARSIFLPTPTT